MVTGDHGPAGSNSAVARAATARQIDRPGGSTGTSQLVDLSALVRNLARRLLGVRTAREGYRVLYQTARRLARIDVFMLATYVWTDDVMRIEYLIEADEESAPVARSPIPAFFRRIAQTRPQTWLPTRDVILHEHSASLWQVGDPSPFAHSAFFVPLIDDEHVIGFVSAQSYEPHAFSVREMEWIKRVANEAIPFVRARAGAETPAMMLPPPVESVAEAPPAAEPKELSGQQFRTLQARFRREGAVSVLEALMTVIERKDRAIRGHAARVRQAGLAAADLIQLPPEMRETIDRAGLWLDIGKVGVPDHILQKAGRLTPDEIKLMQEHPIVGERIAREAVSPEVLAVIRSHHERWDGAGYPDGLRGDAIPYLARLLAIADSYAAMIADRPWRQALAPAEAAAELRRGAGQQYDPNLVNTFLQALQAAAERARQTGAARWQAPPRQGR